MSAIRILQDAVVDRIAAGEVVERPAAVVKELVENALDAGARAVRVELRDGGRALVRVGDDGAGMGRQDALLCIERHATSKIRTEADLARVGTLGFRGEALPSIASVSRFELTTRRAEDEVGTRLRIEGGKLLGVEDAGCPVGTEVVVRSLFFNVPARRKFLRARQTELAHCVEAVFRQALGRPEVDFRVEHEGRVALMAAAAEDRATRARDLLGEEGRHLLPVAFRREGIEVVGLTSPLGVHRGSGAGAIYLFVNGRFVRDPVVRRGLNEAYRGLLPRGRFPVVVLELSMAPERVDVNVHPTKTEVRFQEPWAVMRALGEGLREVVVGQGALRPATPADARPGDTPLFRPQGPSPREHRAPPSHEGRPAQERPPGLPAHPDDDPALPAHAPPVGPQAEPPAEALGVCEAEAPQPPASRFRALRAIGTLGDCALCEDEGDLVVLSLPRAAERLALARLAADRAAGTLVAEPLIRPVRVDLGPAAARHLQQAAPVLEELGVKLEALGAAAVTLLGLPGLLDGVEPTPLLRALAEALARGADPLQVLARHAASQAPPPDSPYALRALLASLDEAGADPEGLLLRIRAQELAFRLGGA